MDFKRVCGCNAGLSEPWVKLELLQGKTLLGFFGQTHCQEILAVWRKKKKKDDGDGYSDPSHVN